jgi:hypothetical protein
MDKPVLLQPCQQVRRQWREIADGSIFGHMGRMAHPGDHRTDCRMGQDEF